MNCKRNPILLVLFVLVVTIFACSAIQPPNATGPRTTEPLYPVLLAENSQRREASLNLFNQFVQAHGSPEKSVVKLHPVTATIEGMKTESGSLLNLPKVGIGPVMNEEETRESLRRLINDWQRLIGADPLQLSLVERLDQADGTKIANYEQRPFRYPLRGDYGKLQIHFTADRHLLNVSSTCIPDAERLQASLAAINPQIKSEDAIKQVRDTLLSFTAADGKQQTYKLAASDSVNASGLAIYAQPSKTRTDVLEFHLVWELEVRNALVKNVYLDAVKGEIVAAR